MRNNRLPLKIAAALLVAGVVGGAVGQADAKLSVNGTSLNGSSQTAGNGQELNLSGVEVQGIFLPSR